MMEHIYPAFERGRIMKKNYCGRSETTLIQRCRSSIRSMRTESSLGAGYTRKAAHCASRRE